MLEFLLFVMIKPASSNTYMLKFTTGPPILTIGYYKLLNMFSKVRFYR